MPFDPAKPASNTPLSSTEVRDQLNALNQDLLNAMSGAIAGALSQTSNNTNAVSPLGIAADGSYNPGQMQDLINKVDELINALRR